MTAFRRMGSATIAIAAALVAACGAPEKADYPSKSKKSALMVFAFENKEQDDLAAKALQALQWNVHAIHNPNKEDVLSEIASSDFQIFYVNAHSGGSVGININKVTIHPADLKPKSNYMLAIYNSCLLASAASRPTWNGFDTAFKKDAALYANNTLRFGSFAWAQIIDLDWNAYWARFLFEDIKGHKLLVSANLPKPVVTTGAAEQAILQATAAISFTIAPGFDISYNGDIVDIDGN